MEIRHSHRQAEAHGSAGGARGLGEGRPRGQAEECQGQEGCRSRKQRENGERNVVGPAPQTPGLQPAPWFAGYMGTPFGAGFLTQCPGCTLGGRPSTMPTEAQRGQVTCSRSHSRNLHTFIHSHLYLFTRQPSGRALKCRAVSWKLNIDTTVRRGPPSPALPSARKLFLDLLRLSRGGGTTARPSPATHPS